MEAILALKCTETYHIVTAPVLVEELTCTLVEQFGKRRIMVELRSMNISTDFVEQRLWCITIGSLGATRDSLGLGQKDIGIAEDWNVVRLVTSVLVVVVYQEPLYRLVTLAPSTNILSYVDSRNIFLTIILQYNILGLDTIFTFILERNISLVIVSVKHVNLACKHMLLTVVSRQGHQYVRHLRRDREVATT